MTSSSNKKTKNVANRAVVLVVGMHRSGTSALTRGLQSLGIELGNELHGPALDNLKGFWEDKDLLAINEKILHSLGCQWDSVRSIPLNSLQGESFQSLREEARKIVQKKSDNEILWGVKDPRFSRLLPFWIPIFEEIGIQPFIVMSIRQPTSIARSLAIRNLIGEEKAALLTLSYWLDILRNCYPENLIVVDYDDFLCRPEDSLNAISGSLNINVSPEISEAVIDFSSNFLSDSLRHNIATDQDSRRWEERGGCFSLVIKLYKQLLKYSSGKITLKDASWDLIYYEFDMLAPMLLYVDALSDASHGRTHDLEYQIGLRDQEIIRLNNVVEKSSNDLHCLSDQLSTQMKQLEKRQARESELELQLKESQLREFELGQQMEASQAKESELEQQLKTSQLKEAELWQQMEASQAKESELEQQLEESQLRESELVQQLETTHEREFGLAHRLEQTQQCHNSLLSYQAGMKRMLEKERLTVLKPVLRRLYKLTVAISFHMPTWLQGWLKRLKNRVIQRPVVMQIPVWQMESRTESISEEYEDYAVFDCGNNGYDVIIFPVIDWHFRVQRPQHIAKGLAEKGHRVFYLSTTFGNNEPGGEVLEQIGARVFVCQLNIPAPHPVIYERMPSKKQQKLINEALNAFLKKVSAKQIVTIVDHPFWRPAALAISGAMVVYDCMDDHGGFSNNADEILKSETQLLWQADLVITTSAPLSEKINKKRKNVLIRNAADSEWFSQEPEVLAYNSDRPVVGYFGAISEWFDIDLVIKSAESYPEYDFVLVGSTYMCDTKKAEKINNIHFIGEVPYSEIKSYLYAFDVCLIPFQLIELIQCTNPVKLYEYLASGKPVVATDMPELRLVAEYAYVSKDVESFIQNIAYAMEAKDEAKGIASRKAFALENQWVNRVERLEHAISDHCPFVSVVVLTYNNLEYTRACLYSLEQFTYYPNWELIIVDNASTDGSKEFLREYENQHDNTKVILNDDNHGFSAGNNIGIKAAMGEYVVILNNDTYVTEGWLWGLIRYFQKDDLLGLIGPVTNNIGNEARINIEYNNMEEMSIVSRKYTQDRIRQLLYIDTAAFFCVAIKKSVIDEIGLLDEAFGRGFFEDDDYCMRTRMAGYKVAVADDVFVHHHLSASFNKLKDAEKQILFETNKAIYEEKWGAWVPHAYRNFEQ